MQSLTETLDATQKGTGVNERVENMPELARMHVEKRSFLDLDFVNCSICEHHYDKDFGTIHYCESGHYLFRPRECEDFKKARFVLDVGYLARKLLKLFL